MPRIEFRVTPSRIERATVAAVHLVALIVAGALGGLGGVVLGGVTALSAAREFLRARSTTQIVFKDYERLARTHADGPPRPARYAGLAVVTAGAMVLSARADRGPAWTLFLSGFGTPPEALRRLRMRHHCAPLARP